MDAPSPRFRPDFRRLPWPAKFCAAALLAGVAGLTAQLWTDWRLNPDLSHGFFMPAVFLLLLHESRRSGEPGWRLSAAARHLGLVASLLGGLLALAAAGLYAVSVGWTHALVSFALTASLVLLLAAGSLGLSRPEFSLVTLNWSAATGIGLWLLCAPIPHGTYARLTLGLQLWVSESVLHSLHLLGIAAVRHGNIIELARGSVGVEEACSGVRSLISCIFAGLLFSALLVRRTWSRAALIALAVPLALGMNFLRSLALTLLANDGVNITGTWHDATGFAVLAATAAVLGALALWLARVEGAAPAASTPPAEAPGPRAPLILLTGGLALAVALVGFFVANTRSARPSRAAVPDLVALLPAPPAGWSAVTTDLFNFSGILHTEHLAQRSYSREGKDGPVNVLIYLAYWQPGQASVSMVALHTPDACWPGSGWVAQPVPRTRLPLAAGTRPLAEAEARIFTLAGNPQHVWFWHLYDGHAISYSDPYSATELLRIAWRFGFRRDGDQLFVRISSNRPWEQIANEPPLVQFFANTRALGL